MLKKLAVIRRNNANECPYGLSVVVSCLYAGDSIDQMVAKDEVEEHKWEQTKASNRRIYRHSKTGTRCPYADKIVVGHKAVHCDRGEFGEKLQDFPIRPSPYYPRVFTGLGTSSLMAYPVNSYWDNLSARETFTGIYSIYASTGEINIRKDNVVPDPILAELVKNIAIKEE